jgi:hypothetical protein
VKAAPLLLCVLLAIVAAAAPNERKNAEAIVSRIPRQQVDSSAIATIGYSKKLRALEIEFINGAVYRYLDIPIALYRELMAADSKARFYDKNIRGRYRSVHVKQRPKK